MWTQDGAKLGYVPRIDNQPLTDLMDAGLALWALVEDAQFNVGGARLPVPLTVAVPLRHPLGALFVVASAGLGANIELHQPLRGETIRFAQQIGIRALLYPQLHLC